MTDTKILAIAGPKGGVGKTKLNLGVSCTLAMLPHRPRVLLVDLCQDQGMLSYMFASERDRKGMGMGSLLTGVLEGKDAAWVLEGFNRAAVSLRVSSEHNALFDFLPAASDVMGELTIENKWVERKRGDLLSSVLQPIAEVGLYDYIVIDTIPLQRLHSTASVMAIADALAVALDVQNMENVAGVDRFVAYVKHHGANLAGIIENLYDPKVAGSRLAKQFVDLMCRASDVHVIATVPRSASVSNTSQVFEDEDGLSTGVYALAERDKSQRHHLNVVIERFKAITNALLEASNV